MHAGIFFRDSFQGCTVFLFPLKSLTFSKGRSVVNHHGLDERVDDDLETKNEVIGATK